MSPEYKSDCGALTGNPDGAVRNFVLPLVMDGELGKLSAIVAQLQPVIGKAENETRDTLHEQLTSRWLEADTAGQEALEALRSTWGLADFKADAADPVNDESEPR